MKRRTDGHIAATGHHSEKDEAHSTKAVLSEELGHAAFERDGSALGARVHNQLGGDDGRVGDIHDGQGGKEKVHG